jgi:hypothetical protein
MPGLLFFSVHFKRHFSPAALSFPMIDVAADCPGMVLFHVRVSGSYDTFTINTFVSIL